MSGRVQADFVLSAALCIFQFKVTVNLSRSDTSTPAFDLEKLQYLYTVFFFFGDSELFMFDIIRIQDRSLAVITMRS